MRTQRLRPRGPFHLLLFGWFVLLLCCFPGCASDPAARTTRMTVEDFNEMAARMPQSLIQSGAVTARGPDSPPWVVSMDKVLNLSSDTMTQAEQWSIMTRLRGSTPIQDLWDRKNIRFVMPPERVLALRQRADTPEFNEGFARQRRPTHTLTATFRSITRAQAKRRTEFYYCEFQIVDLATGETVWSDRFEFKRAAHGHIWD